MEMTDGWRASLELRFQRIEGVTRIAHRRHCGPLVVQRAFHPEGAPCHVYVIHPPGGLASGDRVALVAAVAPAAHALLTTPAAGKFYRRGAAGAAHLSQTLEVHAGMLEWLPQENIYYPQAAAEVATIVQLSGDARFIGWEIGCFGLPANGLGLDSGSVRQRFELWRDGRPLLLERLTVGSESLAARWGLGGHPAAGTFIAYPAGPDELAAVRAAASAATAAAATTATPTTAAAAAAAGPGCAASALACTLVDGVLICRGVAPRADRLKQAFVSLWCAVRPAIAGREAVSPRIWAT
jgi:urease accessory protein